MHPDDEVALEATGNGEAIVASIRPKVARVVVSNPIKTRAVAEAKVQTDKVDARILAQLLAADFLPLVWLSDEAIRRRRRVMARRTHLVRQRTRIKNQVQAILHRNLMPRPPVPTCSAPATRSSPRPAAPSVMLLPPQGALTRSSCPCPASACRSTVRRAPAHPRVQADLRVPGAACA